jgi:GPH family glycoside/pentoside/hexuronide:cation symporter
MAAQVAAPVPEATVLSAALPVLDRRTRLAYAAGDVPNAIKMITAGLFGFFFYTSVMGLSGSLVGIAGAIGLVWDAVIDPYIGHLSDRSRSRWGRRHAFMLAGAVTMGLGFWLSFSPPRGLSQWALFAWVLGTGFVVRTATSLYRVPYFALGAELSRDYDERTRITGLRGILGVLGSMATASLSFVLFFPNRGTGDPKLDYDGYPAMGLAFGVMMTLFALAATLGTRSWAHVGAASRAAAAPRVTPHFLATSWDCLRNRSFRVLFATSSLFFLSVSVNATLSIHFFTYYVEITDSKALSVLKVAFYLAGFLGVLFWLRASRGMQKHRLYVMGTLSAGVIMLAVYFLMGKGNLLGTGHVAALLLCNALVGFFASTLWFVPPSLLADVVDEDELATGERREGSFFGLYSFGQQLAGGLALVLTGVLVDGFAGLVPGQVEQSAETVRRIGMLYAVLPGTLLVIAAGWAMQYKLGRKEVAAIQRQLDGRRAGLRA